jgi:hypothetical protein
MGWNIQRQVPLVLALFDRPLEWLQNLFRANDNDTTATLTGIDVPATTRSMAELIGAALHSTEARVALLDDLLKQTKERARTLFVELEAARSRLVAAQHEHEDRHRGSLVRILGLVFGIYLGTLCLALVLGLLLVDTTVAWIQLPVSTYVAQQIARTAEFLSTRMGLNDAATDALIARVASESTAWHPSHLYTNCTYMALGLTCGLMFLQTLAQTTSAPSTSWSAKTPFLLADLCFSAGLYFLRARDLSSLNLPALAIAMFDASILITSLLSSARVGAAIHKERELRGEHARARTARQLAEQAVSSTESALDAAVREGQVFALELDQLTAQRSMKPEHIADVLAAGAQHTSNTSKNNEQVRKEAQILHLFKKETSHVVPNS